MNVEAIKIDLTTSGLTQKKIAEKHGITTMIVNKINMGYIHAEVEPKAPGQIRRESYAALRSGVIPKNNFKYECEDQESLDFLLSEINNKPGWPKVISIELLNQEQDRLWVITVLKKRERILQVQLAKVTLMINAIETNDYSDLPPSALAEIEEAKKIISERPETDPQQPQPQPQPLKPLPDA